MTKILLAIIMGLSIGATAFAQVPEGSTGGRSGGPNQSQAVIKENTTGGRSGGPNQGQFVKKSQPTKKKTQH